MATKTPAKKAFKKLGHNALFTRFELAKHGAQEAREHMQRAETQMHGFIGECAKVATQLEKLVEAKFAVTVTDAAGVLKEVGSWFRCVDGERQKLILRALDKGRLKGVIRFENQDGDDVTIANRT